jgi:hypothetical protein
MSSCKKIIRWFAGSQPQGWEPGAASSSLLCFGKLELPKLHSQAGAWERTKAGAWERAKNGLKCRVATRLFIQPGVQLCPYAKK